MKITDRIKRIQGVDNAYWDGACNKLTVYHHGDREAMKVRVAHALREADVIDSMESIILIS